MEAITLSSVSIATPPAGSRGRRLAAVLSALASMVALVLSILSLGNRLADLSLVFGGVIAALRLNVSNQRILGEAAPGSYRHDAEGIHISLPDGDLTFAEHEVVGAVFESPECLAVERKDGTLIRLGSPEPSRLAEIADDLGCSSPIVYRLHLLSPGDRSWSVVRIIAGVAVGIFAMATLILTIVDALTLARVLGMIHRAPRFSAETLLLNLLAPAFTVVAVWFLRRKTLVVGADGLSYGFVRRHYVPFTEVVGSERNERGVRLFLTGGRSVDLPVVFSGPTYAVNALFERIEKARASLGMNGVGAQNLGRLDRRNRSVEEWLRALDAIGGNIGEYRAVPISAEELTRVVEDPAEPTERRVGAVLALGKAVSPDLARRVRVASRASVDEDTKIALEAAEEGRVEEEAIERAAKKRSSV